MRKCISYFGIRIMADSTCIIYYLLILLLSKKGEIQREVWQGDERKETTVWPEEQ